MDQSALYELTRQAAFHNAGGGEKSTDDKLKEIFGGVRQSAIDYMGIQKHQQDIIKSRLDAKKTQMELETGRQATQPIELLMGQAPVAGMTAGTQAPSQMAGVSGETITQAPMASNLPDSLKPYGKLNIDQASKLASTEATLALGGLRTKQSTTAGIDKNAGFKLNDDYVKALGDFPTVDASYRRIVASAQNPSPAGDLSLLFNYMKILDPNSVVRESEFAQAARTGSFGQEIQAYATRILNGQRLTPEQRLDFSNRAKSLYDAATTRKAQIDAQYEYKANSYGVDPKLVLNTFAPPGAESTSPNFLPRPKKSGGVVHADAQGNKAIVYPDGTYEEIP